MSRKSAGPLACHSPGVLDQQFSLDRRSCSTALVCLMQAESGRNRANEPSRGFQHLLLRDTTLFNLSACPTDDATACANPTLGVAWEPGNHTLIDGSWIALHNVLHNVLHVARCLLAALAQCPPCQASVAIRHCCVLETSRLTARAR